jgi:2-polyprenyl-3-methyl-5-hydroxy-6-metoxy-1,4-benzoquinol methylase
MSYNKISFWENRNNPNNDNGKTTTPDHIKIVKPFLPPDINLLDYGPGVGRMIDLYKNQTHINFYDISPTYKSRLIQKCKNNNLKIDKYIIDKSGKIKTPFEDKEFDIVCAFEVLLHSPENEIEELINELARIGKKVIITTWYQDGKFINSGHCWTRDYKTLLMDNNFNLIHWKKINFNNTPQIFFIYSK